MPFRRDFDGDMNIATKGPARLRLAADFDGTRRREDAMEVRSALRIG
jgi:hypothetical protein